MAGTCFLAGDPSFSAGDALRFCVVADLWSLPEICRSDLFFPAAVLDDAELDAVVMAGGRRFGRGLVADGGILLGWYVTVCIARRWWYSGRP